MQIFERLTSLILQTGQQSSRVSLNDSELEIWESDKFYKLSTHHSTYVSIIVTLITEQIAINVVVEMVTKIDVLSTFFLKCMIEI